MREPQSAAVGGGTNQSGLVIQILGADDVTKINLFNRIQALLLSQKRWPKLLYLPKYQAFDTQDSHENLLAANLVNLYLARQFDVITNLADLPQVNSKQVVSFQATSFNEQQLLELLQARPTQLTANLAKAIRLAEALEIPKRPGRGDFLIPAQLEPAQRDDYQTFIKQQIKLYYQLKDGGLSAKQARIVLPLSLAQATATETQTTKLQLPQQLEKLPVPEITKQGAQQLVSTNPNNELELVSHILYELSDVDYQTAIAGAQAMAYVKKSQLLRSYLKHHQSQAPSLKLINYVFDIVASLNSCLGLLSQPCQSASLQTISPNLGYPRSAQLKSLPESLQASLKIAFKRSAGLHQSLQAAHGPRLAENACLLGHRVRLRINLNAAQLYQRQGRLAQHLQNLAATNHPIINQLLK